jgi:hypothetical protein
MFNIKLWQIYSFLLALLVIFDAWKTTTNLDIIDGLILSEDQLLGYRYLMLYTKVLHILECFYFSSLLVQMKISNIITIRLVKLICLLISITISCRLNFTSANIIYISLQAISIFFLHHIVADINDVIYHKYNKNISTDINILVRYILYELIEGCKVVAYFFLGLLMLIHITHAIKDEYIIYSIIKCCIFFVDRILSRGALEKMTYYMTSLVLIGGLSIFSLLYIVYLFATKNILNNMVYFFNEIVLLSWFVIFVIFISIELKHKNDKLKI